VYSQKRKRLKWNYEYSYFDTGVSLEPHLNSLSQYNIPCYNCFVTYSVANPLLTEAQSLYSGEWGGLGLGGGGGGGGGVVNF